MGNRIFISVIITAAAALFYTTFFFKKSLVASTSSPENMPRAILAGIIITGLAILLRDWKLAAPCHAATLLKGSRFYVVLAIPSYLLAMPWLGFAVSTCALLFILFIVLGEKKITARTVAINGTLAIGMSALVFFLFTTVFHIQLPTMAFLF